MSLTLVRTTLGVDMLIEQPWRRVKNPTPIPEHVTSEGLAGLGDAEFAELLRGNLLPRDQAAHRRLWESLWAVLHDDDALADRALDVLEEFEDITIQWLQTPEGGAAADRARRFLAIVQQAAQRVTLSETEVEREEAGAPLAWIGRRADRFNPAAQRVIHQLVTAIDTHRAIVGDAGGTTDVELWAVLKELKLDPAYRR